MRRTLVIVVAVLVAGTGVMLVRAAGAEKAAECDPASVSQVTRELPATGGARTPEEALAVVAESQRDIVVPGAAVVVGDDGPDHAVVDAVDPDGNVAYTIYIDELPRIHAFVQKLADGTYGLAGYETCLRFA